MRHLLLLLLAASVNSSLFAQSINEKIRLATVQLSSVDQQRKILTDEIEGLKLQQMQADLDQVGLPALHPGDALVRHAALTLAYAEKFEQARWVAHIISPDVVKGTVFRTNDFRVDAKVPTGSAEEADYFLKKLRADSTWEYDGFGYDRGHLAPSADFRWSKIALSESYYYSNMSPQLAEFNRGAWGDLEDAVRGYLFANPNTNLYVVTGPVLKDGLPKIERGKNKVSIPTRYYKVILDLNNKKGIAFLMPNEDIKKPVHSFAVPINEVEKETGLDFFTRLPAALQEQVESTATVADWFKPSDALEVEPLAQENLPRNHFNTDQSKNWMGNSNTITVAGTVVGARLSRAGNMLINLDKPFPNQVFTVFIKKEDLVNFDYDLADGLNNKVIFVKGKVINQGGTPTMYIKSQSDLRIQSK